MKHSARLVLLLAAAAATPAFAQTAAYASPAAFLAAVAPGAWPKPSQRRPSTMPPRSASAAAVTVTLSNGATTTFTPSSQAYAFRGFTTALPITSLTMAVPGASRFNTIDNLTVGVAAAVPEPGSWLMMALGLAGLAWVRRARAA